MQMFPRYDLKREEGIKAARMILGSHFSVGVKKRSTDSKWTEYHSVL